MTERLGVREFDDDEGQRLGMDVPAIAKVAFTSEHWARDVIRNFNADGFGSLYPKCKGGHPPKSTLPQRREIKKVARARPGDYDLPFSTRILSGLAQFLVAEGVVEDISHEGLRILLREEGVTLQRLKTWKASADPRCAALGESADHGRHRPSAPARLPHQLSGGMRQRAMITMGLLFIPDLVIMDQPTSAPDAVAQRSLMVQMKELQQQFGFAVIFVRHDMSLVSHFSDRPVPGCRSAGGRGMSDDDPGADPAGSRK